MENIGTWIRTVTGTAVLCAAGLVLIPDGRVKKAAKVIFGFVMMFALVSIFKDWKVPDLTQELNLWKYDALELSGDIAEKNDALNRTIIEEKSEAYILDKGVSLGVSIDTVKVNTKWSEEGFWYPYTADICAAERSGELEYYLTSELGIVPENIKWTSGENK